MKRKLVCIIIMLNIAFQATACSKNDSIESINWLEDLEYLSSDVHDITFSRNGIPQIPIKISGSEYNIQFDTGNSGDLLITTAIENKIKYKLLKQDKTYNGDGSDRGYIKNIQIDGLEVFGESFSNINGIIGDWKLYSGNKFNGNIGLNYFIGKRVTLDYNLKKIAISTKQLSDSELEKDGYSIIPLLKPTAGFGELLFVLGFVNGKKTTIYFDTGIMPSHVDPSITAGLDYTIDKKSKYGDFNKQFKNLSISIGDFNIVTNQTYEHSIAMSTSFEEPVGLIIGSDILKDYLITIDKLENRLIIKQELPY